MNAAILTVNSGSSSLKAELFLPDGERVKFRYLHIGHGPESHAAAFDRLLSELGRVPIKAVGHRFVHGGDIPDHARLLDDAEHERLRGIAHLAPLHMPQNIMGAELCRERFRVPHVACYDTAFHVAMPELSRRFPIAKEYGIRRFGFHGLNYAHIARILPELIGETAKGRVVMAHLGSGASLCLMVGLQSADTTMGYTPAGGIPMGTRSGDLDPGVMLELARRFSPDELTDIVFHKMGLLALSDGESAEMSSLLSSGTDSARFAVDYFCRQISAAIGSLAAKAGGIDALVFTAGIGENSSTIRASICEPLGFLGLQVDAAANESGSALIGLAASKPILRIDADEESTICLLTRSLCDL